MAEAFKAVAFGEEEMRRKLDQVMLISRRPSLVMREVAAVLEDETEKNFVAQGRPTKWKDHAPLSEKTEFKRIGGRKGYKKNGDLRARSERILKQMQILIDSGTLADSIHSRHGHDFALVGAATPYARIHQLGGKAGKGRKVTIPARPYLPFTQDFKLQQGVDKQIADSALSVLKQAISD